MAAKSKGSTAAPKSTAAPAGMGRAGSKSVVLTNEDFNRLTFDTEALDGLAEIGWDRAEAIDDGPLMTLFTVVREHAKRMDDVLLAASQKGYAESNAQSTKSAEVTHG